MTKTGAVLAAKILDEIHELSKLVERVEEGWKKARANSDDFYIDGVALNLHSLYTGLERIFDRIAVAVDGERPEGSNWHQEILNQMSLDLPDIRPAVISLKLKEKLDEYRGFRHVVRNVYSYRFNPHKMETLVDQLRDTMSEAEAEITAFAEFLRNAE